MRIEPDNKITIKAPAKINLHLEVIGKRDDNFHELSMIMQSISLYDFLEIELNNESDLILNSKCKDLSLNDENIIIKAASLLKEFTGNKRLGANIFLTKNIPIGAGLAGGSANAAATLIGLNKLWNLKLDYKILHELAIKLGSDVPFCLNGGFQFCFGRGEVLEKYDLNSNYGLILIKDPRVSISTADIYKKYSQKFCKDNFPEKLFINERRDFLRINGIHKNKNFNKVNIRNDLQKIVQVENESVREALNILSKFKDSLCFSMSGSGPSCFSLFKSYSAAEKCHKSNIEKIKGAGYESWLCRTIKEGVSII